MIDKPEIVSTAELNGWEFLADNHCILEPSDAKRLIHTVRELVKVGQRWSDFANDIAVNNWQDYTEARYQTLRLDWDALIAALEGRKANE